MKFDYIIIGGGLCGLSAGIRLAEQGKKTAIVSSGQSALHFCAGSFGLLGKKRKPFIDTMRAFSNGFSSGLLNVGSPLRVSQEGRGLPKGVSVK